MAQSPLTNGKSSDLYSVGGPLTNTVKPGSESQLSRVAINSGVVRGKSQTVDAWSTKNNTMYGVNIDGIKVTKEPSSGSY